MAEVILSDHAKYRLLERQIDTHEAKKVAKSGKVTKTQPDGTIIKTGVCSNGKFLTVAILKVGNKVVIKTVYYED
jgi:hypothetical protein